MATSFRGWLAAQALKSLSFPLFFCFLDELRTTHSLSLNICCYTLKFCVIANLKVRTLFSTFIYFKAAPLFCVSAA